MINLAIAIGSALLVLLAFGFALGGGEFNFWYGILPSLIALVAVYLYLVRRTLKQVEAIMNRAQVELAKAQKLAMRPNARPSEDKIKEIFNRAIGIIKEAYKLGRWQFLLEPQINSQVGALHYAQKEYDKALPYLENSFTRTWMSQGMLAAIYFRRKEYDKMKETFEKATHANKKQSLLWALYAWCLWKNKDRDGAIAVLNRAKGFVQDERIEGNLLALQNKKKMNLNGWNEMWYQFHFAKPPGMKPQQYHPFARKISKRSVYR